MRRDEAKDRIITLADEFVETVDVRRHLEALPSTEFIAKAREYEAAKQRVADVFAALTVAVKEYGNGRRSND